MRRDDRFVPPSQYAHGGEGRPFDRPKWAEPSRVSTVSITRAYAWLAYHAKFRRDGAVECMDLLDQQAKRIAELRRQNAELREDLALWIETATGHR